MPSFKVSSPIRVLSGSLYSHKQSYVLTIEMCGPAGFCENVTPRKMPGSTPSTRPMRRKVIHSLGLI